MGISKKAYARHRNVSPAAVRKAVESGRISALLDGTIDPVAADRQWEENTDTTRNGGGTVVKGSRGTQRNVSKEAVASVFTALAEEGVKPDGDITLTDAKTAHEIVKTHLARLRLQTTRGELIDRAKTLQKVFELSRRDRDAWQSWPARVGALMAAELGVDPFVMEKTLAEYVRDHLIEMSENPGLNLDSARR